MTPTAPQAHGTLAKLSRLLRSHGALQSGSGLATGVIAFALAALSVLAVIAFHFPAYLTTPELRKNYDVNVLRAILLGAMLVAGALALLNIAFGRVRWLSGCAFAVLTLAAVLGGHTVPVGDFPDGTPYIGLDWFILDLLGTTLIFVFVEKLFALRREQPLFRAEWQTDLAHFLLNHLLVGFFFLATNRIVHAGFDWAVDSSLQARIRSLPFALELLVLALVADFVQYWIHRAYHQVPLLWRFHAIHHSIESMDWLAGSRMHMVEVLITRTLVLAPIVVLGFDKAVIDAYIILVGFQAVLNHSNVSVPLGPLARAIVTPNFHHWHHAQDREALDRNFAAHFTFLDTLFGTAVRSGAPWPQRYGVKDDYVPKGIVAQTLFPFVWNGRRPD
ncbi:MAG TPA: sterol desaturase family protein [Burkholderiaceae bacterium]|nr:sterol desaturase family protein [Burkholderiaceae bacterium]